MASDSPYQTVLVVGASRGIGLALVQELAATPNTTVLGTVRTGSLPIAGATTLTADITSDASVAAAAAGVAELDTLIVNAGMGDRDPVTRTATAHLGQYLDTNVLGPHRVIRAFLPALRASPRKIRRIVLISSSSGSIEQQAMPNSIGLAGCYGVSKAALNMLAVQTNNELNRAGEEFTVISVHPGWVATDMGNQHGSGGMPPEVSAKAILKLVAGLTPEQGGKFFKFDGEIMPW